MQQEHVSNEAKIGNGLNIPKKYINDGSASYAPLVDKDFGVIFGNTIDATKNYVASSVPCTQYNGTGFNKMRPIWAAVMFNLLEAKKYFSATISPSEFQTITYVAVFLTYNVDP